MKFNLTERTLPPIEVEIGGVTYPVNPITRKVWRLLAGLRERIKNDDTEAIYEQIPLLLDLPDEVLDALEFRQVMQIVKHITTQLYAPFSGVSGEEKNASKPGSIPPA